MDMGSHIDTQTHRIHSCKKKKKRKWETTPSETKICHGLLILSEISQTQILELKRTLMLSKQSPQYKSNTTSSSTIIASLRICETLETCIEEKWLT